MQYRQRMAEEGAMAPPSEHQAQNAPLQTIGFAVEGDNRGRAYVWVEATSVEAGRARLAPLFPGCRLSPLDGERAAPPRF